MVKSLAKNVMEGEIGGLAMVFGGFASLRNWLEISGIMVAVYKRGRQHKEVQSPTLQGENPMSGLRSNAFKGLSPG